MGFLKSLAELFKGGGNAERTEECVSGGDGRECRIIHSFSSIRERAVSDIGGIRVLAAACADERSRDTGQMPSDPVCRESRALIAAAKSAGCFVEADSIPGTRYTIRTGESEVRLVQKEQVYYKIKDPFAKSHLKKHPVEFGLFEHIVHNILFPDCRLDFLCIAEDVREARIVYRQKAVRSDMRPTDKQIAECLSEIGLQPEGRYSFGNNVLFVTDVGQDGDNVLLDDERRLRFIDPIIGFKQSLLNLLTAALEDESNVNELIFAIHGVAKPEQKGIVSQ